MARQRSSFLALASALLLAPLRAEPVVEDPRTLSVGEHLAELIADDECGREGDSVCGLNAIQLRGMKVAESQGEVADAEFDLDRLGTIAEIYTYGAPATSNPAFTDHMHEDGNFRGLRSYTENFMQPGPGKQVDGGAIFEAGVYKHPKVPTAVLHTHYSFYEPGGGQPSWPTLTGGMYANWGLHGEHHYAERLDKFSVNGKEVDPNMDYLPHARLFRKMAFMAYDTQAHVKRRIKSLMPGWRIVAHEIQDTIEAKDNVWLAQEESSLDCVLTFTGTSTFAEFGTSIKQYSTGYCGYKHVHSGYRDKLWWLTQGLWKDLRPKLSQCKKVSCTGHSLGGSLCDIYAACANSRRISDPDFKQQMWEKGEPALMPSI